MAEFDIFISYRRVGGFETAKHLYDLLRHEGYAVSFDIDTLREGKFNIALLSRIKMCQDFVLIVDPHAFDRTLDPHFNSEHDWLRQELSYALSLQKNIIPILLAGASFPEGLPDDIREVKFMNGPGYSKDYFDSFYSKLKSFLNSKPKGIESSTLELSESYKPSGAEIHIETDTDCAVFRFKNKVLDATIGEDNIIYLQKGKHRLSFVSQRFPDIKEQIVLDVPSNEYSDIISIKLRLRELEMIPFTLIEQEGKYGFVSPQGESMIPCIYDGIKDYFKEFNVALVKVGEDWGMINKLGQEIVPPVYFELAPNDKGLFWGTEDDKEYNYLSGAINAKGDIVVPFQYEKYHGSIIGEPQYGFPNGSILCCFHKNDKIGFLDSYGKEAIPFIYDDLGFDEEGYDSKTGLCCVRKDGKYGFIDKDGETIIPFIYDRAYSFSSIGLARVLKSGKSGFVDCNGQETIPLIYDDDSEFGMYFDSETGLCAVSKDGKYGYIDKNGETIIPFVYNSAEQFWNGLACVLQPKSWKYGFIDPHGETVIPFEYDKTGGTFHYDYATVCKNEKWGAIDKSGHIVIPLIYDEMYAYEKTMVRAKKGDKWFLIDMQNNIQEVQP